MFDTDQHRFLPLESTQQFLLMYEPAVSAWRAVPGIDTDDPRVDAAIGMKPLPIVAWFQTWKVPWPGGMTDGVIRIVQVPLAGGITGSQPGSSQISMNTSLSPLAGSGALVASIQMAPSVVQTIPESSPVAAVTLTPSGAVSWTLRSTAPSYQRSIQITSSSSADPGV